MRQTKVNPKFISKLIPVRKKSANKTHGGKCLIVGGSKTMSGAGVLAAGSAYRVGAGYVYLATDVTSFNVLKNPEFLILDYRKKLDFTSYSSVAIGPGLGQSSLAKKLLFQLIRSQLSRVVVDADALNLIAKNKWLVLPTGWILTPHEGELNRLVPKLKNETRKDWFTRSQKQLGCILLLKGEKTLISDGIHFYEVTSGNRALAKAGTGDVLTGMIAGYISQGLQPINAVVLAAYHHGITARLWTDKKDYLSMTARDLSDLLPISLFKLRKKTS